MENKLLKLFVKSVEQQCSRSVETSKLDIVFKAFKRNYILVPLEVFGKDPFKTLISTILSARTKDEVTLIRSKELFKVAPNFKSLKNLSEQEISKIIYPVGFYKTKAKHLHKINITKVPNTREELMKIDGVGRKTANLVLNRAFNIPAIKTKHPEETEKELVKIIPEKYWPDLNRLFVSIGRQYTTNKKLLEFLKKEKLI